MFRRKKSSALARRLLVWLTSVMQALLPGKESGRSRLISCGTAVVSLRRQGLWKSPVMLLTAHKLRWLILPLSFSPPFFFFSETELSVTAELVPTSSWNISSELDKGIQWGHTGEAEEGRRRETPF